MPEPPFDVAAAHDWFAEEFCGRAAKLAKQTNRTAPEMQEMLQLADAAAVHLQAAGTPLGAQRAATLLAVANLKAGNVPLALEFSQQGLGLSEQNGGAQTPLERASILAVAAKAHNLLGNATEALRLIMPALAEADKLDEGERAEFDLLFGEG